MSRSKHNLSYYKLASINQGKIYPVGWKEVYPGDTFQHSTSVFSRVSPLVHPVMHPVHQKVHHWFVPFRLLWDGWEDFITGGPDGDDTTVHPYVTSPVSTGFANGSLADYLGLRPGVASRQYSALPFRAYGLIFNEFYRDQDLVNEVTVSTGSGSDTTTNTSILDAAWMKDYFTTSRPWEQKGPQVTIPLGQSAPIKSDGLKANSPYATVLDGNNVVSPLRASSGPADVFVANATPQSPNFPLYADLEEATGADLNDLREASAVQRFQEARARFGSRYAEYNLSAFNVRSPDARLQRPEYLGGGTQTIQFSEVVASSASTFDEEELPLGTLGGHGISAMRTNRYRRFFEEHGIVMSFLIVQPVTMYADATPRSFLRKSKFDYFQPEFAHVGQQAITNEEVQANHSNPTGTFAFQDRYDELRRSESSIAGEFRTTAADWHMARIFSGDVTLNADFVKSNPTNRIYASQTTDQLYCMIQHKITAIRPIPQTGTSMLK